MKRFAALFVVFALGVLGGCATPLKMDLTTETRELDTSKKSILLLAADLSNQLKTSYQPEAFVIYVEKPVVNGSEDRLNFLVDNQGTESSGTGNKYLFRMSLDPGKYIIRGVGGFSGIFPVRGNFFMPMHMEVDVAPGSVAYVGRVMGKIRARDEAKNEFRAGAVIPLIDQAVTGFSSGTWDVTLLDAEAEDAAKFRKIFPVLNVAKIQKKLLPPFNRQAAQEWWDKL